MKTNKPFQFCDLFTKTASKHTAHKNAKSTHHAACHNNWPQRFFHTEATHKSLTPTFQVPCKLDDNDAKNWK